MYVEYHGPGERRTDLRTVGYSASLDFWIFELIDKAAIIMVICQLSLLEFCEVIIISPSIAVDIS